jgi:hypothetical protein
MVPQQNIKEINYFRELFSPEGGLPPLLEYWLCVGALSSEMDGAQLC